MDSASSRRFVIRTPLTLFLSLARHAFLERHRTYETDYEGEVLSEIGEGNREGEVGLQTTVFISATSAESGVGDSSGQHVHAAQRPSTHSTGRGRPHERAHLCEFTPSSLPKD